MVITAVTEDTTSCHRTYGLIQDYTVGNACRFLWMGNGYRQEWKWMLPRTGKLYIYDGPAGQMIQGLGNAHNADVLLEPMVQTPFYTPTRLLIECKDYDKKKVGLDVVRGVLGLREDINHFEIVDTNILQERRKQNRNVINNYSYIRYTYQLRFFV